MSATASLLYRMGIEGDEQVRAAIAAIGTEEEKTAARAAAAANVRAERVATLERQLIALRGQSADADAKALALYTGGAAQYEAGKRRELAAEEAVNRERGKSVVSVGQLRAGTQQLSYQIGDVAQQFAMGTPPMVIFAQQGGQVVQAVQMMTGSSKGLIGFLGGPWGAVVMGGAMIMGMFAAKHLEASSAIDDEMKKLKDGTRQTDASAEAKRRFALTIDGVRAALREQQDALRATEEAEKSAARRAWEAAETKRLQALAVRQATIAKLEEAKVEAQAQMLYAARQSREGGEGAAVGMLRRAQERVAELDRQIRDLNQVIPQLEGAVRPFETLYLDELVSRDPVKRLEDAWDKRIKKARETLDVEKATSAEKARQLSLLRQQRDTEIDAARKREQATAKQVGGGHVRDPGETTRFIDPVAGRVTGQYGEVRGERRHAGLDYAVPVGTGVRATAAGTVVTVGQMPGYGNIVIVDHGGGTTTRYAHLSKFLVKEGDQVGQGATIALSGGARGAAGAGNSRGPHLHYEVRSGGRAVDPRQRNFRTDDAQLQLERDRKLSEDIKAHEQGLLALERRYDPLAAAAREYREELDRIAKLTARPAGAGDGVDVLSSERAAEWTRQAEAQYQKTVRESQVGWQIAEAASKAIKAEQDRRAEAGERIQRDQSDTLTMIDLERTLIRASNGERDRQIEQQRLMLVLRDRNIDAESEIGRSIMLSGQMISERAEMLRREQAQWDAIRDIGGQFIDNILDPGNWDDWGAAGKRILDSLLRDMIMLAAINPIKNQLFGTDLPEMGGIFKSLFGGGGSAASAGLMGSGGVFGDPSTFGAGRSLPLGFATGTHHFGGGMAMVGERGPEMAVFPRGTRIVPANDTRRMMMAGQGAPVINLTTNIDARGATPETEAALRAMLDERDAKLKGELIETVADIQQRTGRPLGLKR